MSSMTQGSPEPGDELECNFPAPRASVEMTMTIHTLSKKTEQRLSERRRAVRAARTTSIVLEPQDSAVYCCPCGHEFSGDVSTHVACPRCGTEQAW